MGTDTLSILWVLVLVLARPGWKTAIVCTAILYGFTVSPTTGLCVIVGSIAAVLLWLVTLDALDLFRTEIATVVGWIKKIKNYIFSTASHIVSNNLFKAVAVILAATTFILIPLTGYLMGTLLH